MAAPKVGDFAEDLLELNQNVSYGVVLVRGSTDVTHGNSQLRDTPPLYEDVPNPTRIQMLILLPCSWKYSTMRRKK